MDIKKVRFSGEAALLIVLIINSLGVDLMTKSGFGKMIDVHNAWLQALPDTLPMHSLYFIAGFILICFGICLANNCMLPIIPTDTFPRDLSEITRKKYKVIKTTFDLCCLSTMVILSFAILHRFYGIGVGTVFCAFLTGKGVSIVEKFFDKHVEFYRLTGDGHVVVGRGIHHSS